jgi:transcriptional regulator
MVSRRFSKEQKKGSADLLILALLEGRPRHGYEIGRLIAERSNGALTYHIASLYPTLYRLEDQGLVEGRWVEKAGQRRRRYYRLTAAGRTRLAGERSLWQSFFAALDSVAGLSRP